MKIKAAGYDRELIHCKCNTCGTIINVFYDIEQDYYICRDCVANEQNLLDEKSEESDLNLELFEEEQRYRRSLDKD